MWGGKKLTAEVANLSRSTDKLIEKEISLKWKILPDHFVYCVPKLIFVFGPCLQLMRSLECALPHLIEVDDDGLRKGLNDPSHVLTPLALRSR